MIGGTSVGKGQRRGAMAKSYRPIGRYKFSNGKVIYESLLPPRNRVVLLCPRHGPFEAGYINRYSPSTFSGCPYCETEEIRRRF